MQSMLLAAQRDKELASLRLSNGIFFLKKQQRLVDVLFDNNIICFSFSGTRPTSIRFIIIIVIF